LLEVLLAFSFVLDKLDAILTFDKLQFLLLVLPLLWLMLLLLPMLLLLL